MAEYLGQDDTTLHYQMLGHGERVVTLLHSLALDGTWFLPLTAELGAGYRFVLPDLRGHGASGYGQRPVTLSALVNDVVALWDTLGIESSIVAGISMGGMVAQGVATAAPERVEALVLMATTGRYDEAARAGALKRAAATRSTGGLASQADVTLRRWFADVDAPLAIRARSQLLAAAPNVHADFLQAMVDVESISKLERPPPTLVLGGEDDRSTSRPVIESLAEGIPGAQLDFVAGGHLTAFTHPRVVAQRIRTFLGAGASLEAT